MDWKQVVADLVSCGVVQSQIATECGVAQSTVSDLHRGATKSPSFEFGQKLITLHAAKCASAPASHAP